MSVDVSDVSLRQGRWRTQPATPRPVPDGDARFVIARLEEAGATLLALPSSGYTTHMRGGMPEIVRSFWEAYGLEPGRVRANPPTSRRIDQMEEALGWIRFIPLDRYILRRIVGAAALIHPVTSRPLYSFRRLGRTLGYDYRAVQRWHAEGIDLIVAELHRRKFNFFS